MVFKAIYLPWVLVAFNMILRGGGLNELIGILVGHAYFFLAYQNAHDYNGMVLLRTPQFLYDYYYQLQKFDANNPYRGKIQQCITSYRYVFPKILPII